MNNEIIRRNILFIAPLPPPITGQSFISQILLDHLTTKADVRVINFAKKTFTQGISSLKRVIEVLCVFRKIIAAKKNITNCYFTISQSVAGNVKDLIILWLLGKKRKNTILHLHGGGLREVIFKKNRILKIINRFFYKDIRHVIVLGESLKKIFEGVCHPDKLAVVSNLVVPDYFIDEKQIKTKYASLNTIKLLYLSNLIESKGYNELLSAFIALDMNIKNKFELHFAGKIDSAINKENFFKTVGQNSGITYHGVITGNQKRDLLQKTHILILPTYYPYEGQPVAILEAYAAGNMVFTTNQGGISDIFKPEINGFEIEKKSIKSIIDNLNRILIEKDKMFEFALRNYQSAKQHYTEEIFFERIDNLIAFDE